MHGLLNKELGLAQIIWGGNSTESTAAEYKFTLPSDFTPKRGFTVPLKDGYFMEIRKDGYIALVLGNKSWSGGQAIYALNN